MSPYRNIFLLALGWACTLATSTLLTTIGPLAATYLNASETMSPFTIGIFLLGAATSSVPSAKLFQNLGRFGGFSVGCLFQIIGSIFGVASMLYGSLMILYLSCFCVGLGQGIGQFYRFCAVEVSPESFKGEAVTYVLSGGIIAALLGPSTAAQTVDILPMKYTGSFIAMAVLGIMNQIVLSYVQFPLVCVIRRSNSKRGYDIHRILQDMPEHGRDSRRRGVSYDVEDSQTLTKAQAAEPEAAEIGRPLYVICSQPLFVLSCATATLAHTLMVMLMGDVTLKMAALGLSFANCTFVMEMHFFCMFAPGVVTGGLIRSQGTFLVLCVGGVLYGLSLVTLSVCQSFGGFALGMMILGVAWNFSFSASTVMLTDTYEVQYYAIQYYMM